MGIDSHWKRVNANANRVRTFTAHELWTEACEYFEWCENNPIKSKSSVKVGKAAKEAIDIEHIRPFTIKGMCLYCGIDENYLKNVRQAKDEKSDYYIVVSKILYVIHTQNLEHAMVGLYNPVMTGKVLSIGDEERPNSSLKIEVVHGLPKLSDNENEILENLEFEDRLFKPGQNPEGEK